jgi:hypothetical protein
LIFVAVCDPGYGIPTLHEAVLKNLVMASMHCCGT